MLPPPIIPILILLQALIWDMGTLPLHTNTNDLLATLTFRVKATEDCANMKQ
jgi:hypothetical protein